MFTKGFKKEAAALDAIKNVGAAATAAMKSPATVAAVKNRAAAGAVVGAGTGAIAGAVKKDDKGERGGLSGALKGAVAGGAGGAVTGAASGLAKSMRSPKQLAPGVAQLRDVTPAAQKQLN